MITIIIPAHNTEKYVAECIRSVRSQTATRWQCVVVDDGSTDSTGRIINDETAGDDRFLVLHTRNRGVAAARNLAIRVSEGEYILPLDSDDTLVPDAIETFEAWWDSHPTASLLVPQIQRFRNGVKEHIQERTWRGYDALKKVCSPTNSSCFRKWDWERVGGYREGTMYEDWEFWIRLLCRNDNVQNIPKVLINYRVREGSRLHEAMKRHDKEVALIREMNRDIYEGRYPGAETLVVIPFLASAAQGDELTLAVTGWRKHFKNPYRIVIVGDRHPVVDSGDDICFIECPRINPVPGQYTPHLDHVHKFRMVRKAFPDTSGFIYTCDDIYATADFTLADVKKPKMPEQGFFFAPIDWRALPVDWYSDKGKTGELCDRNGLPRRNWVCHLPVYYEWDKLLAIYDRFGCDRTSYIVENIYFNMEYPGEPYAINSRQCHDEVRTSYPSIRPIGSVTWVSNANCGWSAELEDILRKHYESL